MNVNCSACRQLVNMAGVTGPVACPHCGATMQPPPRGVAVAQSPPVQQQRRGMRCQTCGCTEFWKTRTPKSQASGCLVFIIGGVLCVFFFWSLVGLIAGIFFIVVSLAMMCAHDYWWVCQECRTKISREASWWEF